MSYLNHLYYAKYVTKLYSILDHEKFKDKVRKYFTKLIYDFTKLVWLIIISDKMIR